MVAGKDAEPAKRKVAVSRCLIYGHVLESCPIPHGARKVSVFRCYQESPRKRMRFPVDLKIEHAMVTVCMESPTRTARVTAKEIAARSGVEHRKVVGFLCRRSQELPRRVDTGELLKISPTQRGSAKYTQIYSISVEQTPKKHYRRGLSWH